MIVNRFNMRHTAECLPKDETFFEIKDFLKKVKEKIISNPLLPIQQIYEKQRGEAKQSSTTTFPDYEEVKSQFKWLRSKNQPTRATCLADVVVHNTKTNSGDKFLIFDNMKKNRILVFASPDGLKALSESKHWHADGTFHTKSKYFGQLYTIHAYFPDKK